nr:unnamed protein product [Digitaria exilis]
MAEEKERGGECATPEASRVEQTDHNGEDVGRTREGHRRRWPWRSVLEEEAVGIDNFCCGEKRTARTESLAPCRAPAISPSQTHERRICVRGPHRSSSRIFALSSLAGAAARAASSEPNKRYLGMLRTAGGGGTETLPRPRSCSRRRGGMLEARTRLPQRRGSRKHGHWPGVSVSAAEGRRRGGSELRQQ